MSFHLAIMSVTTSIVNSNFIAKPVRWLGIYALGRIPCCCWLDHGGHGADYTMRSVAKAGKGVQRL
jgi:hypothetical protein